jgi:hypothetical protein
LRNLFNLTDQQTYRAPRDAELGGGFGQTAKPINQR